MPTGSRDQDRRHGATAEELHICRRCDSRLVQPLECAPVDMQRFGARLEQGTDALVEALELLERSNVEREIERFSAALDRNQLTAEDF